MTGAVVGTGVTGAVVGLEVTAAIVGAEVTGAVVGPGVTGTSVGVGGGPVMEHPHSSLDAPQKPLSEQQSEESAHTPFPLLPPPHVPPVQ